MIYIDVQMPTNCYDCWIRQNMGCCIANANGWLNDRRDDKCPLKTQEPRVMTLEEVEDALDSIVWVDRPLFDNLSSEYALIDSYSRKLQIVELRYPFCDKDYRERSDYATYGKAWRCWTSRPTDEQREAVEWDG